MLVNVSAENGLARPFKVVALARLLLRLLLLLVTSCILICVCAGVLNNFVHSLNSRNGYIKLVMRFVCIRDDYKNFYSLGV